MDQIERLNPWAPATAPQAAPPLALPTAYPPLWDYVPPPIRPRPPRVWPVFAVLLIAFVFSQIAAGVVLFAAIWKLPHAKWGDPEELRNFILKTFVQRPVFLAALLCGQLAILASAVGTALLSPVPFVQRLRLGRSTLPIYGYVIVAIGSLSVSVLYDSLIQLIGIQPMGNVKMFQDVLVNLPWKALLAAVLVIGIMPGIAEELLFRGYTQTRLTQRWGRWPSITITALLFGLMHLDPLQSPFAFLFGIYVGYVAERTGSIRPTMIGHATNNSAQVLAGTLLSNLSVQNPRIMAVILASISSAVLISSILYLVLAVRQAPPPPGTPQDYASQRGFEPIIGPPPALA